MYQKRSSSWIKHTDFILLDLLTMTFSFYLGYVIRHGFRPFWQQSIYLNMFGALVILDLCVAFFRDAYSGIIRRGYLDELKESVTHCLVTCALLLLYFFLLQRSRAYSRETVLIFSVVWGMLTYLVRCIRKYTIRIRLVNNPATEQMLILTDLSHAVPCVVEMTGERYRGYQIAGVVLWEESGKNRKKPSTSRTSDREREECKESSVTEALTSELKEAVATQEISVSVDLREGGRIGEVPIVATQKTLEGYILSHVVDSVFIDAEMPREERDRLIARLVESGVTVHNNLARMPHGLAHHTIEKIGIYTVITTGMHIATSRQILYKRVMDILGGLAGSVLAIIAMLIFGPVIYIQSPGPVFFTQTRVGKNGRKFRIYKLRSMYMDAEEKKAELMEQNEMEGLMFKMEQDPRIIPIGRFLRKFSIDELPQFFNVLKGDMSLVGTRPPTVDEFEQYQMHHRGRLNSKPGITGLWQVSGRSEITDFEEVVRLDTQYIINWSVSEDIRILWKTVKQVVKGEGAV